MQSFAESNLHALMDSLQSMLVIFDHDDQIIEINEQTQFITGFTRMELIGQKVEKLFTPEVQERARNIVNQPHHSDTPSLRHSIKTKDGKTIELETLVQPSKWDAKPAIILHSNPIIRKDSKNEEFDRVFENNQSMMSISCVETGVFVKVNALFLKTLGFKKEEVIGKTAEELKTLFDFNAKDDIVVKLNNEGEVFLEEIKIRKKDGSIIDCYFSISKITINQKDHVLSSAIDITKLKKTEKRLTRNLNQQRLIAAISQSFLKLGTIEENIHLSLELLGEHLEVSRVYIFEDAQDGLHASNTYEWCNIGIESQKEKLQNIPYSAIPNWKRILEGEGKIMASDIHELPSDLCEILETQKIKAILVLPLFMDHKFSGFIGFDECTANRQWKEEELDVLKTAAGLFSTTMERLDYQNKLSENEIRLKFALDNTETGLWDWNPKTRELVSNNKFCEMLGFEEGEMTRTFKHWKDQIHQDDLASTVQALENHFNGKTKYYESTHRVRTKSNHWKWVNDKGKLVARDKDGKPLRAIGTRIDVDQQKKRESELRELNTTKDKFFSIIAHDLRTPIAALVSISNLLTSESETLDKSAQLAVFSELKKLSSSTFSLLENLLFWARNESKKIECHPLPLNISATVSSLISEFETIAKQKQICMLNRLPETCEVLADENMIKLVLRNLISNALKFTPKAGKITISVESNGGNTILRISDTGVGMDSNTLDKAIRGSDFFSTARTHAEQGTGLGLKLCKTFLSQHNSKLEMTSVPGKGTTCSFQLMNASNWEEEPPITKPDSIFDQLE